MVLLGFVSGVIPKIVKEIENVTIALGSRPFYKSSRIKLIFSYYLNTIPLKIKTLSFFIFQNPTFFLSNSTIFFLIRIPQI